jgi:hypothetical protein
MALDIIDQVLMVFAIVLGLVASTMGVYAFWYLRQFKIKFRLRELTRDRKLITDDKARIYKMDGVTYWQLLKTKLVVPVPPSSAIEIDKRGIKTVEAYLIDDEIQYIVDKNTQLNAFEPYTTKQRHIFSHQLKKAFERRTKSWKDLIVPITAIVGFVVIVVSLMVFYGDMAKPLLEMGQKQAAIAEAQADATRMLKEIIQNKQTFGEEETPPE